MTLLPDTLSALVSAGASLRVSARKLTTAQLNQLAANAAASGACLTITDADALMPAQAHTLASVGGAAIAFELV